LRALALEGGLILLYHGVWGTVPQPLSGGLHNVAPEPLSRQIEALKQDFTVVSVDEFAQARSRRGLAAVSFDDGYRCIVDEGLDVFRALNVPISVYVNGSTLNGEVFWRDKVRYIQANGLVEAFEEQMRGVQSDGRFYRYTKNPGNNSLHVVAEIDRFLESSGLHVSALDFCLNFPDELIVDDLITWGNHSHSHYVMSSLTADQQFDEISKTAELLASKPGLKLSQIFSIPFGEEKDFNAATVDAARQCGYTGLLLSRGQVNLQSTVIHGLPAYERLMPRESDTDSGFAPSDVLPAALISGTLRNTCHQQTELGTISIRPIDNAHQPAFANHGDTIRQGNNLVEILRYHNDRSAAVTLAY